MDRLAHLGRLDMKWSASTHGPGDNERIETRRNRLFFFLSPSLLSSVSSVFLVNLLIVFGRSPMFEGVHCAARPVRTGKS